jgi:hypothetical protein
MTLTDDFVSSRGSPDGGSGIHDMVGHTLDTVHLGLCSFDHLAVSL